MSDNDIRDFVDETGKMTPFQLAIYFSNRAESNRKLIEAHARCGDYNEIPRSAYRVEVFTELAKMFSDLSPT